MGTIYILPYNQWNEHVFGADTIDRHKEQRNQRNKDKVRVEKFINYSFLINIAIKRERKLKYTQKNLIYKIKNQ